MLQFIFQQLLFYISIGLILFLPGYFLVLATRGKRDFSMTEFFVIIFGSSIVIINFLMILLGKLNLKITRISILLSIAIFSITCYAIHHYFHKKTGEKLHHDKIEKKSAFLVVILIFLTIFIKTIYFQDTIPPTSTDLGHHMYWSKLVASTGSLPVYEKAEIGRDFTIGNPEPIADFIIGEHLIFAAINLVSGIDFISYFPSIILFLVQIMSVFGVFILARQTFKNNENRNTIAILALFLIGPLYALASPQAKFVSGGVIGNTIGNFFIPFSIFLFIKAFSEKNSRVLAWAIFGSLGLAYTHHLSMFVFLFSIVFAAAAFIILNFKTISSDLKETFGMFLSPQVLAILGFALIFIFFIYTPTYFNASAVDTAMGETTKATRAGLSLKQFKTTAGEARFAFAFLGFMLLLFAKNLGKYNQAFMLGWLGALAMMSLAPSLLLIDIPSNRIASYVVFPVSIVAAFMFVSIFSALKSHENHKSYLNPAFIIIIFFMFLIFISADGMRDNSQALNNGSSAKKSIQTYAASEYLADRTSLGDIILKDHNYLSGDSWIKLFFMRGYNYPLSRGYFKRYEDEAKPREQCTNLMISLPNSDEAKKCFNGTKTDFIMINPMTDSAQFKRINDFWQIYASDEVGIFYKSS